MLKNPPDNAGDIRDMGLIPGSGRSPGGGHGNPLLAWIIPWTEKPSGLQSTGLQRVRHDRSDLACTQASFNLKKERGGMSLVVQGLRLHASSARGPGWIPVAELNPHATSANNEQNKTFLQS